VWCCNAIPLGLYLHWGNLADANTNADRALRHYNDQFLKQKVPHANTQGLAVFEWPVMLYLLGRNQDAADFLRRNKLTWSQAKDTTHKLTESGSLFGATPDAYFDQQDMLVFFRMLWVLVSNDEEEAISVEQVLVELPPPDELARLGIWSQMGPYGAASFHPAHYNGWTSLLWPALVLEKLGAAEAAMAYADKALDLDHTTGGSNNVMLRSLAQQCRGRLLASDGKMDEATGAFGAAETMAAGSAYWMLEALAVRDLTKYVLEPTGNLQHGRDRLAPLVGRLAGPREALVSLLGERYV
jgi:tetratricopeptide (TPR) repeat protein